MKMKRCTSCRELKAAAAFYRRAGGGNSLRSHCKSCMAAANRARIRKDLGGRRKEVRRWRRENPERAKRIDRRARLKRYGLTPEEYRELLEEQGGVCAICEEKCSSGRRLAVDHDHETGVVRGLLCSHCNTGLGGFRDNPDRILDAALYLWKSRAELA